MKPNNCLAAAYHQEQRKFIYYNKPGVTYNETLARAEDVFNFLFLEEMNCFRLGFSY